MWSYEVGSELDVRMVMNCWRMACILPSTWNVDFALVDEREKNRMGEELDELGIGNQSFVAFPKCVVLKGENGRYT